jgi:hypothetical protein
LNYLIKRQEKRKKKNNLHFQHFRIPSGRITLLSKKCANKTKRSVTVRVWCAEGKDHCRKARGHAGPDDWKGGKRQWCSLRYPGAAAQAMGNKENETATLIPKNKYDLMDMPETRCRASVGG